MSRFSRTVTALGWVSFCTDLSSEMIVPLLPAFVAGMGAGPAFVGLLEGSANAVVALLKGVAGARSDRGGRRAFVLWGYGLSSVARPMLALAASPLAVLGLRLCDRIGKGLRAAPRDALIAQATPPELRGAAFGWQRSMDHAGAVGGPLLAMALLGGGLGARPVFALAALPAAAAMVVAVCFVREAAAPAAAPGAAATTAWPRGLRAFLVVTALASLSHTIDLQLLLRAQEVGVDAVWTPLLWALLHVVRSALSRRLGAWSDRVPRRRVIGIGLLSHAVVMLGFGWLADRATIWPLFLLHGLHAACTEGAERGFVADLCGQRGGRAFGRFHMIGGLASLPLALGFGALWEAHGAGIAFTAASALAVLAAFVLRLAREGRSPA